ncbi:Os03g0397550 [Oryza sativa Japonica Group]|uniref:Os03g0397550 protein n=1 Tax=Oryza sativa subsp. japonica TaxID=39947 RepID=A0A0P0VYG7_ORYSJ|nr:hypothetical protein EE612_017898 [Oryza sativa]BAS84575.1 Os03g0397550 [Oryza sativa Japonica Group]
MLLILIRVELHYIRDLASREGRDHLPGLSIPILYIPVIPSTQELSPIIRKRYISDRLRVPHVRPHTCPRLEHIPDLNLTIHTRRQQKVSILGEKPNRRDPLGVPNPLVHTPLGNIAALVARLGILGRCDP